MIHEKSCGAVVYSVQKNELMYLMVTMLKGHTGFAKGHMEAGENEKQTTEREIREETGLTVQVDTEFRESIEYSPYEGCIKEVVYFVAMANDMELKRQETEIKELRWMVYEEALTFLTHANDRKILEKAHCFIKKAMLTKKIKKIMP